MYKHTSPISGVATVKDKWVITAGYDNRVILWDALQKKPVNRVFHDHLVNQCAVSPCEKYVATVSSDYSCRLWDFPQMTLRSVLNSHKDDVESIAFHPIFPWIATCSRDKTIIISNFEGEIISHLIGHRADVISVEWDNFGRL